MGRFGFGGTTELSRAGLVFSRHPEDVSEALQQTFYVQLGVRDHVPEDRETEGGFREPAEALWWADVFGSFLTC